MSGKRLQGRIALVTGASRGIGAAVAKAYAAEGAHVIALARTQGGLEELDDAIRVEGGTATLVTMDLTDHAAIDDLGRQIHERWGRLDILVGNAAMLGDLTPVHHIDPKVWDKALALNVTANARLIRACDPLFRASDAARVVFVTSGATRSLRPFWGIYAASKAALEALAVIYAREVEKAGIGVNLLNPGATRTGMRASAFPGEDPETLPPPEHLAETLIRLAEPAFKGTGLWVAADMQTQPIPDSATRH